ncbi:hypothetical protein BV25DRAFT_1816926, partial [Artomyces pyxidatus]
MFTFRSSPANNHAASRLDRIYIAASQEKHTFEWASAVPSVPTDHAMVSVRFAPKLAPHIGEGRPTFPLHLLHDGKFMSDAVGMGKHLETAILQNMNNRTEHNNPQTLLLEFKKRIMKRATKHDREAKGRMATHSNKLKSSATTLANNP